MLNNSNQGVIIRPNFVQSYQSLTCWMRRAVTLFFCVACIALLLGSSVSHSPGHDMSYRSVLSHLYKVNAWHPVKLGLDNMHQLNKILGFPLKGIPIVHIAGTNGKGSVSLKIAKGLSASGLKAGMFTSPHISSFRERIQVNDVPLSEQDVQTILPELFETCMKHNIPATFFELTTALAMLQFQRSGCDVVVLEAGLGGRQDATNIFCAPDAVLSVITSVQLDHQQILGNTVEKIAMEKAGIMKRGVDVLVGPDTPLRLLQTEALRVGAKFHTLDTVLSPAQRLYTAHHITPTTASTTTTITTNPNTPTTTTTTTSATTISTTTTPTTTTYNTLHHTTTSSPPQDIDLLSQDLAAAALALLQRRGGVFEVVPRGAVGSALLRQALKARPPCRFEVIPLTIPTNTNTTNASCSTTNTTIITSTSTNNTTTNSTPPSPVTPIDASTVHVVLDIAHNIAAIRALVDKVKLCYPATPVRIVLAMSADKDVAECLPPLLELVQHDAARVYCTQAAHPRALSATELANMITIAAITNTSGSSGSGSGSTGGTSGGTSRSGGSTSSRVSTSSSGGGGGTGGTGGTSSSVGSIEGTTSVQVSVSAHCGSIRDCVQSALEDSVRDVGGDSRSDGSGSGPDAVVLVCGTAFMMAEARATIGIVEPRDGDLLDGPERDAQEQFSPSTSSAGGATSTTSSSITR